MQETKMKITFAKKKKDIIQLFSLLRRIILQKKVIHI